MKSFLLHLCWGMLCLNATAFSVEINAEQTHFQIAPLMPLSQDLPVEISDKNLRTYLYNPKLMEEAQAHGKAGIKSKMIPWSTLVAAFSVLLTIALIKIIPPAVKPLTCQENSARVYALARQHLQTLAKSDLLNHGDYGNYFLRLDHIIRHYIERAYPIKASSCTTQEFLQQIVTSPLLDAAAKRALASFLQSTDRVKFARHHPTTEECRQAMQMAQVIIASKR